MIKYYNFAPLDGITRAVFRRVWHESFGGADRIYIPFFSPTDQHRITPKDMRELNPEYNPDGIFIPQVMTKSPDDLIWAAEKARDLGYLEINLNLGCPSGTVMGKGKGAGLLYPENLNALNNLLEKSCEKICLPLSIKTRLGVYQPDEFFKILEIFNRYPVKNIIIHARTAKEKYRGRLYYDLFAYALQNSKNPVCYNGDLKSVEEIREFEKLFPDVETVMIGRGGIADPALFRKLKGGVPANRTELQAFTRTLYQEYQIFYGQIGHAAQRMREVWFYLIHLFDGGENDAHWKRLNKQMRRFRGPTEYEAAEAAIFQELPLRESVPGVELA